MRMFASLLTENLWFSPDTPIFLHHSVTDCLSINSSTSSLGLKHQCAPLFNHIENFVITGKGEDFLSNLVVIILV